jgi:hypothetical protein
MEPQILHVAEERKVVIVCEFASRDLDVLIHRLLVLQHDLIRPCPVL